MSGPSRSKLTQCYTKSSSSAITKTLFTLLPIVGGLLAPTVAFINSCVSKENQLPFDKIQNTFEFMHPLKYDITKDFLSYENAAYSGLTIFNLFLISQSIHSAKNLWHKCNQTEQRTLTVQDVSGHPTQIIAQGTLPLSTFFTDLSLIGSTMGYFMSTGLWSKVAWASCGILGNLIGKACSDDSSAMLRVSRNERNDKTVVAATSIGSNNTYINNTYNIASQEEQAQENDYSDAAAIVLVMLAISVYGAGQMLIDDSLPGRYDYKFFSKAGKKLPLRVEWDEDNQYHLYDKYGEEIEIFE